MWRKFIPNGLTQNRSGNSGSRDRDVAGDALGEAEPAEDAQRAGELGLAVGALLLDGGERRAGRSSVVSCGTSGRPSIVRTPTPAPVSITAMRQGYFPPGR